jgi:rare lipoprotein A (peptidoglycan hydrolase)
MSAEQLGMRHQGVAPVEVRPIEVPQTDQRVAER